MQTKKKVKPLSVLQKTVKMKEKPIYIDTMKLFTRLMIIGERELSIQESLCYELTYLPTSLFTNAQKMRKTNKTVLGNCLKRKAESVTVEKVVFTLIDGGWLLHQVVWDEEFSTFGDIAKRYTKYAKSVGSFDKSTEVHVVFDRIE